MKNIDDLFVNAGENDGAITELIDGLNENGFGHDNADNMLFLLEMWGGEIAGNNARIDFCLRAAELDAPDSSLFRHALAIAVIERLPGKLRKKRLLSALGFRDENTPVKTLVKRFHQLTRFCDGALAYALSSHQWSVPGELDLLTYSLPIKYIKGGRAAVEIIDFLNEFIITENNAELAAWIRGNEKPPSAETWRRTVAAAAKGDADDTVIRDMAIHTFVPKPISGEDFPSWWAGSENNAPAASDAESLARSRSLEELRIALENLPDKQTLDDGQRRKITDLLNRLGKRLPKSDEKKFMSCLAMLVEKLGLDTAASACADLPGFTKFLPATPLEVELGDLTVWTKLPAKRLADALSLAGKIYPPPDFADFAFSMPRKCLNSLMPKLPDDAIPEKINVWRTPDLPLWIWKNRKDRPELLERLNFDNIIKAISIIGLTSPWSAARNELQKIVLDDARMHAFLLEREAGRYGEMLAQINTTKSFDNSERQALLIKLSRQSDEIKRLLEQGAAKAIMGGADEQAQVDDQENLITSIKSFHQRLDELNHLVNKQIPENAKAIGRAREHGDLRENAEYDAARAQQRLLYNRRDELNTMINRAQPTDFRLVEVETHTVVGCRISLTGKNGFSETLDLVGAWDGDPDKNLISYKTKFGSELRHKTVGDEVNDPRHGILTISKIEPLPKDMTENFADDSNPKK